MILASEILTTIAVTVIGLLVIILLLVAVLLYVKQKLTPSGPVKITINKDKVIELTSKYYPTLGDEKKCIAYLCRECKIIIIDI